MTSRKPRSASLRGGIPTLSALVALGAELVGCHDPGCAQDRAGELATHGDLAARSARGMRGAESLRELVVAVGLTAHPSAPPSAPVQVVVPATVVPFPPSVQGGIGVMAPAYPAPEGGGRTITPAPVPPARPRPVRLPAPAPSRPPPPDPLHERFIDGDMASVGPQPPDSARR